LSQAGSPQSDGGGGGFPRSERRAQVSSVADRESAAVPPCPPALQIPSRHRVRPRRRTRHGEHGEGELRARPLVSATRDLAVHYATVCDGEGLSMGAGLDAFFYWPGLRPASGSGGA